MLTLEKTTGNAYTKDDEYAAFSGRVVQTFHTTYYDPKEGVWIKRTVEYIDVGRAEPVTPVDTDNAMTPDPWPQETNNSEAARVANLRRKKAREDEMQANVIAYLRRYGPSHCHAISRDLELPYSTTNEHMRRFAERTYKKVGRVGIAVIWGLVGIHDGNRG